MRKGKRQKTTLFVMAIVFLLASYSLGVAATQDEENNISVYSRVGPGVVNITSVVVERDFILYEQFQCFRLRVVFGSGI